jgi:hypothetical protein
VPEAVTEKVAVWPATMVWLEGWLVMLGATGSGLTVRVALLLVTFPAELLTTTEKSAPLSDVVSAGVV